MYAVLSPFQTYDATLQRNVASKSTARQNKSFETAHTLLWLAYTQGVADSETRRVSVNTLLQNYGLSMYATRPMHEALLALKSVTASDVFVHRAVARAIREWSLLRGNDVDITPANWPSHVAKIRGEEWTAANAFDVYVEFTGRTQASFKYETESRQRTFYAWSRMLAPGDLADEFVGFGFDGGHFNNSTSHANKNKLVSMIEYVTSFLRFVYTSKWGNASFLTPAQWSLLYPKQPVQKRAQDAFFGDDLYETKPLAWNEYFEGELPETKEKTAERLVEKRQMPSKKHANELIALLDLERDELVPVVQDIHEFFRNVVKNPILMYAWTNLDIDAFVKSQVFAQWYTALIKFADAFDVAVCQDYLDAEVQMLGSEFQRVYQAASATGFLYDLHVFCIEIVDNDVAIKNGNLDQEAFDEATDKIEIAKKRIERIFDTSPDVVSPKNPKLIRNDVEFASYIVRRYMAVRFTDRSNPNDATGTSTSNPQDASDAFHAKNMELLLKTGLALSTNIINNAARDWDWKQYITLVEESNEAILELLERVDTKDLRHIDELRALFDERAEIRSYRALVAFLAEFVPPQFADNARQLAKAENNTDLEMQAVDFKENMEKFLEAYNAWTELFQPIKKYVNDYDAYELWAFLDKRRAEGILRTRDETAEDAIKTLRGDAIGYFSTMFWSSVREQPYKDATRRSVLAFNENGIVTREFPGTELPVIFDCGVYLQTRRSIASKNAIDYLGTHTGTYAAMLESCVQYTMAKIVEIMHKEPDKEHWSPSSVRARGIDDSASTLQSYLAVEIYPGVTLDGSIDPKGKTTAEFIEAHIPKREAGCVVVDTDGVVTWRYANSIRDEDVVLGTGSSAKNTSSTRPDETKPNDAYSAAYAIEAAEQNFSPDAEWIDALVRRWRIAVIEESHGSHDVSDIRSAAVRIAARFSGVTQPKYPIALPLVSEKPEIITNNGMEDADEEHNDERQKRMRVAALGPINT